LINIKQIDMELNWQSKDDVTIHLDETDHPYSLTEIMGSVEYSDPAMNGFMTRRSTGKRSLILMTLPYPDPEATELYNQLVKRIKEISKKRF
jgi:hypothetical protein